MSITAPQIQTKHPDEDVAVTCNFQHLLDTGETLVGTPTVTEETSSGITVGASVVTPTDMSINNSTVSAGLAAQVRISGGTAGAWCTLKISVVTSSGNIRIGKCNVQISAA